MYLTDEHNIPYPCPQPFDLYPLPLTLTLPSPTLAYPSLPYPSLAYPTLPYPTLPYSTLPCMRTPHNAQQAPSESADRGGGRGVSRCILYYLVFSGSGL